MTDIDEYFNQQLSNVVAEVQCSKLTSKLAQSYWNYRELVGCTSYFYTKSPDPPQCDSLHKLKDLLYLSYSGSEVAIRDMWDIYRGKEIPKRAGRLRDNGKFKHEYLSQVNRILDDTTHYFGAFWPTKIIIGDNELDLSTFTSRRKDIVNKKSLCWVRMGNINYIQLSLNLNTLDPKEELIRLKNVGKEMKKVASSVIK